MSGIMVTLTRASTRCPALIAGGTCADMRNARTREPTLFANAETLTCTRVMSALPPLSITGTSNAVVVLRVVGILIDQSASDDAVRIPGKAGVLRLDKSKCEPAAMLLPTTLMT